jgi:hypothetical protein
MSTSRYPRTVNGSAKSSPHDFVWYRGPILRSAEAGGSPCINIQCHATGNNRGMIRPWKSCKTGMQAAGAISISHIAFREQSADCEATAFPVGPDLNASGRCGLDSRATSRNIGKRWPRYLFELARLRTAIRENCSSVGYCPSSLTLRSPGFTC